MKTLRALFPDVPLSLTLSVALVILWGTLSPPGAGGGGFPLTDKQAHMIAFAALMLPFSWTDFRRALRFAPFALGFGAAIEVVQPIVGRSGEWADLAADAVGVVIGLAIAALIRRARA